MGQTNRFRSDRQTDQKQTEIQIEKVYNTSRLVYLSSRNLAQFKVANKGVNFLNKSIN